MHDFFGYPLRPLLCAAGFVVTAAGIYYFNKDGAVDKRSVVTEEQKMESVLDNVTNRLKDLATKVPQDQVKELTLIHSMEAPQNPVIDHPKSPPAAQLCAYCNAALESQIKTEQKYKKALKTISKLELEKSDLILQVKTLRASIQEMGELLSQTHRDCDKLTKECKQEREAQKFLLLQNKGLEKKLKVIFNDYDK